jgi:hypothetical protein
MGQQKAAALLPSERVSRSVVTSCPAPPRAPTCQDPDTCEGFAAGEPLYLDAAHVRQLGRVAKGRAVQQEAQHVFAVVQAAQLARNDGLPQRLLAEGARLPARIQRLCGQCARRSVSPCAGPPGGAKRRAVRRPSRRSPPWP